MSKKICVGETLTDDLKKENS